MLEVGQLNVLIDCGMFQGGEEQQNLNFEPFKFNPAKVDFLLVTHSHIDHIGRIPRLAKDGFKGVIYSSPPAKELAQILLEDSIELSARETGDRKEFLYSSQDIARASQLWQTIEYGKVLDLRGIKVKFNNAGHILGSSIIEIWAENKHFVFTGDLGHIPSVLLPPPEAITDADILVIESAYGEREHEEAGLRSVKLERAAEDVASRRGVLMIPAFATERTQDILHLLNEMMLFKRIPEMPVFLDSPLASRVTEVFESYAGYYNEEIRNLFLEHPHLFRFKKLNFAETAEESKKINNIPPPKIIIAGSGMMTGGRILHHARRYLPDPRSILLLVGYSGRGSLGRKIAEGQKLVKIFGEEVPVEAEVRRVEGFSAHADSTQLFSFVKASRDTLGKVFVVQGEKEEAQYLSQKIKDDLGISSEAPAMHEKFEF